MRNIKIITLALLIAMPAVTTYAQSARFGQSDYEAFKQKADSKYNAFVKQSNQQYADFRARANRQYAEFLRSMWKEYPAKRPLPIPDEKPIPIIDFDFNRLRDTLTEVRFDTLVRDDREEIEFSDRDYDKYRPRLDTLSRVLPVVDVVPMPEPMPQPKPLEPIVQNSKVNSEPTLPITLYGTTIFLHFPKKKLKLDNLSPNSIADLWKRMSSSEFDNLLFDCLNARDNLKLCDWAYLNLLITATQTFYGNSNVATALAAYLYVQSGYKMRFGIVDGSRLIMLIASRYILYNHTYYELADGNFFALEHLEGSIKICDAPFENEQLLSLVIDQEQDIDLDMSESRTLTSRQGISVDVAINRNLMEFYDSYPSGQYGDNMGSRWALYANTPLDNMVKQNLYPALRKVLADKNELEAVNLLLNFVQTAFVYGYDNQIWGEDRAFFAEETLFYPYSDCEDRSILFSRLVRDLLGLKVILVYYPNHLATAVKFNSNVQGDCVMVDGQKFIIADPTYVGAPVGSTMQGKDNQTAVVIKLD